MIIYGDKHKQKEKELTNNNINMFCVLQKGCNFVAELQFNIYYS
jgi:hypothetical protein